MLLAEELLLLAYDDERGNDTSWGSLDSGLAGAVLLDLSLAEAVTVEDGKIVATGDAEEPLLHDAVEAIRASSRRRDAKAWIGRLPGALKPIAKRTARGLVEAGVLREERAKVLGLFPRTRFPAADPTVEEELRARLTGVLVDGADPDPRTALLVSLLVPLDLVKAVVPKDRRRDATRRAKEIADQGIVGSGLQRVVAETQAAVMTAVLAATTTSVAASSN